MSTFFGITHNRVSPETIRLPLWHLTREKNFRIDPDVQPRHAYGLSRSTGVKGLFLTDRPNYWADWVSPYKDLYAVRVQPSNQLRYYDPAKPEYFDTDPSKAVVIESLPILDAVNQYPEQFGRAEFSMYLAQKEWDEEAHRMKEIWKPRKGFKRPVWFPKNPVWGD